MKSSASPSASQSRRRGATSIGGLALLVAGIGLTVVAARRATRDVNDDARNLPAGRGAAVADTAPAGAPTVEQALGALRVRDLHGALIPLVTKGEPAIIMVSSVTCGWCKRALKDLGELSVGRPLPRLKLLTLEGAEGGAAMLAREHITGPQLIGPAGSSDQVLLTFRYPGTPTFVAVDRNGRVAATMPGYPMREVMKSWYAVMVGDQDVP